MKIWITKDKNSKQSEENRVRLWLKKPNEYKQNNKKIYGTDLLTLKAPNGKLIWRTDEDNSLLTDIDFSFFKENFNYLPKKGTCEEFDLKLKRKKVGKREIRKVVKDFIREKMERMKK